MPFDTNVFINCPFDADYVPLLRPLTFTLQFLGFAPFVSETLSSGTVRIEQIKKDIRNCKYSVHDLSRSRPLKRNDLPRFNMPYELGLDAGAIEYGGRKLKGKKILILEKERYHYHKVISDIGGQDPESHNDDPQTLVTKVRNWVSANSAGTIPGPSEIWTACNQFATTLTANLLASGWPQHDIDTMPIGEYMKYAKGWIANFLAP